MSHYEVLGVPVGASAAAIRQAYRQRAKREHPDKGGSDEQFQKLQQAYEALADTDNRRQYDQTIMQERERRRRQAEARKQEEERLAKQAADRARFVAQQRQRMVEQEKAEAALRRVDGWAKQPSPALGSESPGHHGRAHQRGSVPGRARSAGAARQPGAGRGMGRGDTGGRSRGGYAGPTAHERSRYGYADQVPPSRQYQQHSGVYAGVTGMDSSDASAYAGQQDAEAVLFGSLEGRYYHKRHDCTELQVTPLRHSSLSLPLAYSLFVRHCSCLPVCGQAVSSTSSQPNTNLAARCAVALPSPLSHLEEALRERPAVVTADRRPKTHRSTGGASWPENRRKSDKPEPPQLVRVTSGPQHRNGRGTATQTHGQAVARLSTQAHPLVQDCEARRAGLRG